MAERDVGYRGAETELPPGVKIHRITKDALAVTEFPHRNNATITLFRTEQGIIVVDPGSDPRSLQAALAAFGAQEANITDVLLTHIHHDHVGYVPELVDRHGHIRVHGSHEITYAY